MKLQPVRGTKDYFGAEAELHEYVISTARSFSQIYNYQPLSIPIFEFSDVFHRTLGETSDIVSKETYTFFDRDNTSITLRPEFTAGVVRSLITNGLTQTLPIKFFSSGSIFRYERPQKGRYRQFQQINCEFFGSKEPNSDVEVIALANEILTQLGLIDFIRLEINSLGDLESRKAYRSKVFEYFSKYEAELSEDSKIRLHKNPLRILDSKDPADIKLKENAPKMIDSFNQTSKDYFASVLKGLDTLGIKYTVNNTIVRGLDYYSHTVFEFITNELGSQGTVLGGGRYDGLVELMGGPSIPAIGFAAGVERLAELISAKNLFKIQKKLFALIPIGERAEIEAIKLAKFLRTNYFMVELDYEQNTSKRFKRADKINATAAIVFGDEELDKGVYKIKELANSKETTVEADELIAVLRKYLLAIK